VTPVPIDHHPMESIRTRAEVEAEVERLFGPGDLAHATGVIHVVSTWLRDDGIHAVLRIGPASPRSETDGFVLGLARARADVIVTTGAILRAEPTLRIDLPAPAAAGLTAWRRDALGRREPPRVLVLTSGRGLDLDHPAFSSWATPVVLTSMATADALRAEARARGIAIVAQPRLGLPEAIAWALGDGARTVVVEAGPSTARALYRPASPLDEILLSTVGIEPVVEARGEALLRRQDLTAHFSASKPDATIVLEPSGPWQFERWIRRPAPSDAP
jgi:riboflavin biosynthesis pyrimidine reductase